LDQKVEAAITPERTPAPEMHVGTTRRSWPQSIGLSGKLLLLTILFVMLAEVLIFVPSVANFRINWLTDRLTAAQLASLAAEASPNGDVPQKLRTELLRTAQVKAVALKRNDQRQLVLAADMPLAVDGSYDLSMTGAASTGLTGRLAAIWDALEVLFGSGNRTLRIVGQPGDGAGDMIEVVLPEAPLKAAMIRFGLNILALSVIISIITAALVYLALNTILVRPIMRIAQNMLRFSRNPEDASRIIVPSDRGDEIGTAERELSHMQTELSQLLHQKSRLAALGLAVSKINHDLRNMLANAQLLSDRLASSPDPNVQKFAPKLIASLDRAIAFCNDTLRFGRAEEAAPKRELMLLMPLVAEVGEGLALPRENVVGWRPQIEPTLRVDADRDQLYRVLSNLARNAMQAIEAQTDNAEGTISIVATRIAQRVRITISDDGPGVPPRAREHLFQAFQGSTRRGGTGLGLAIAHELVAAHGGSMRLLDVPKGASFEIEIPDRNASP
jgi:signal transduction histidine kinase